MSDNKKQKPSNDISTDLLTKGWFLIEASAHNNKENSEIQTISV